MGLLNCNQFLRQVSLILSAEHGDEAKCEIVKQIVVLVKRSLHTEAVGIRLREGDDFPYYSTIGFTDAFVVAEKSLCKLNANGQQIFGNDGKPMLVCTCGSLLNGTIAKNFSGFTGTSVCVNNIEVMLKNISQNELPLGFRGRCHQDGYKSVLLVKIENDDKVIGLLQCNSVRANAFGAEDVMIIEKACSMIGKTLSPFLEMEAQNKRDMRSMIVRLEESIGELERIIKNLPVIDERNG